MGLDVVVVGLKVGWVFGRRRLERYGIVHHSLVLEETPCKAVELSYDQY